MQCNFNYKTEKKLPRQFYTPRRSEDDPATYLPHSKVMKSYEKCVKNNAATDNFYMNTGRELPCQLDNRVNTNLTNYYVGPVEKCVKNSEATDNSSVNRGRELPCQLDKRVNTNLKNN